MHPLDGPRAKIKRAESQVIALNDTLQRCFKRYPYSVGIAEFDRKAGRHNLRVKGGPPTFPDEWGVLIGEIAHNLRSALDGLAWQLALLKTTAPYDRTAFPIYLIGRTTRSRTRFGVIGDGRRLLGAFSGDLHWEGAGEDTVVGAAYTVEELAQRDRPRVHFNPQAP